METRTEDDCDTWSLVSAGSATDEDAFEIVPRDPENAAAQAPRIADTTSPNTERKHQFLTLTSDTATKGCPLDDNTHDLPIKTSTDTYLKRIATIKKENEDRDASLLEKSVRDLTIRPRYKFGSSNQFMAKERKPIGGFEKQPLIANGSTSSNIKQEAEPGRIEAPNTSQQLSKKDRSQILGGMRFVELPFLDTTKNVSGIAAGRCFTLEDRPDSWPTLVSPFLFPRGRKEKIMESVDRIRSGCGKSGMMRVILWCQLMASQCEDEIWQIAKKRALELLKGANHLVKFKGVTNSSMVSLMVVEASDGLVTVVDGNLYCRVAGGEFTFQDYGSGHAIQEYLEKHL